jgi:hypothetical protein
MRPERVTVPKPGEGAAARAVARLPGGDRLSRRGRIVVAVLVAAGLVALAFVLQPWGFMALGLAVGLLFAAGVNAVRAALKPVVAIGSAALPLLIPPLVFLAAGVVKSPPALQVVVGLFTLLLAAALIRPDWELVRRALTPQRRYRTPMRAISQVGVPLLIAAIAVLFFGRWIVQLLGDSDQTARTLFILAVGFWAWAAVLRTIGYASTFFRGAVALALLWLLLKLAAEAGLVSGRLLEGDYVGWVAIVTAGLLGITVLVEFAQVLLARDAADEVTEGVRVAAFLETPVAARWVIDRLSVAGIALAVLSAVFLLGAAFAANSAGGRDESAAGLKYGGQPATRPADMSDTHLAAAYAPVLLFTEQEYKRWTPTRVDPYVQGATLTDWEGRSRRVSAVSQLPKACPSLVPAPCFVMRQNCPPQVAAVKCAEDLPHENAVYVRVARREQWLNRGKRCPFAKACGDGSPDPFARAKGPYAAQTSILLQYWFFYPYNEWVAATAVGDLKEIHASDWEAVTVGLSANGPLWVAYSAHCAGSYAAWSQVPVSPGDPARLRPLVAVADGSQANYRVAKQTRVPNFAECSGITKDRIKLLSYAANVRDHTDDTKTWSPAASDLLLVDASKSPMNFPGTWAPFARIEVDNLGETHRLGKDGAGPASPPLQPLWRKPMNAIFGGGAWVNG